MKVSIKPFNAQLKDNPLRSKHEVTQALVQILEPPLHLCLTSGRYGRLHMSDSAAVYSQDRNEIEGFYRLLWGLGPLFADSRNIDLYPDWWLYATTSLTHAVDPNDPDYWGGDLGDYDQLFVEMGAVIAFLYQTKKEYWDKLLHSVQDNMFIWLDQVNHKVLPKTNWLMFRILVNNWFVDNGHPDHAPLITADEEITNGHYLDHGWYYDGYVNQLDNYIPGAYHFFALIRAAFLDNNEHNSESITRQCQLIRERATAMIPSYAQWFTHDGACLPFGRSLDYKFDQADFWAAAVYAHVPLPEGWTLGMEKHLLLNNLRWWFKQSMFNADGTLPVGYCYPNMNMAEGYNGPGSAYWTLTSFEMLALPDDDPFWTTPEADNVAFASKVVQKEPRMILVHSKTGKEVQAFTAGQHSHEHAHGDAKYEKFVYSSTFGFSVPKGRVLLKQGAFDSTLAVSESEFWWRTPYSFDKWTIHSDYTYSLWKPWNNVSIQNFVIPDMPWHVRIHVIKSQRALHLAEGSFSAPNLYPGLNGSPRRDDPIVFPVPVFEEQDLKGIKPSSHAVFYQAKGTITGLVAADGFEVQLHEPEPNTNVQWNRQIIPLQTQTIDPGTYTFISLYLGDREGEALTDEGKIAVPAVALNGSVVTISDSTTTHRIELEELKA